MKRFTSFIVCLCMALSFAGCTPAATGDGIIDRDDTLNGFFKGYGTVEDVGRTQPVYDGGDVAVSRVVKGTAGKTRIEVEGAPFVYLGASIRTDAFMNCDMFTYAEIEYMFKEAAELGVTCVQVPVEWKDIEPNKDEWDFSYLHAMLTFCNRYALKAELLWFGTNMVGDTHGNTVPNYIIEDGKTYTKLDALRTGEYWNYYGLMWYLDFNDPDLMAREAAAVAKMMDYLYTWDSEHGGKKPVIGVQVLNEADAFFRWRLEQYNVSDPVTGAPLTFAQGLKKVADSLDFLGREVKKARYKVYTRTNFADSTQGAIYSGGQTGTANVKDLPDFAKTIFDLEGIDMVGDDSYKSSVSQIKGIAYMYGQKTPGNFAHFAENDGNYANTPSLILAAAAVGAGYSIYDLVTSPFFVANATSAVIDQGIILLKEGSRTEFVKKAHYGATQSVIAGLKKGSVAITKAAMEDFAVFNVKKNTPDEKLDQTVNTRRVSVNVKAEGYTLGYAAEYDGYLYLYFTGDAGVTLAGGSFSNPEQGEFKGLSFVKSGAADFAQNALTAKAGTLYRVKIDSSLGALESTVWDNIA